MRIDENSALCDWRALECAHNELITFNKKVEAATKTTKKEAHIYRWKAIGRSGRLFGNAVPNYWLWECVCVASGCYTNWMSTKCIKPSASYMCVAAHSFCIALDVAFESTYKEWIWSAYTLLFFEERFAVWHSITFAKPGMDTATHYTIIWFLFTVRRMCVCRHFCLLLTFKGYLYTSSVPFATKTRVFFFVLLYKFAQRR